MSLPKPTEIVVMDDNIATAINTLAKSLSGAVQAGRRTCVHCLHFDERDEACTFYNPVMRPPARVIAFGCPAFEDDIPF